MSQRILLNSEDSHSLRVRVSQLESAAEEHKRMIYHLESSLQQEKSETNNLLHIIRAKNIEIEDLKSLLVTKDEERTDLFEQVQRYLSSTNMPDREQPAPETKYVSRWVQTLVEITPPEEVEDMKEEIDYLRQQLEDSELELAQTRRLHGDSMDYDDDSGSDDPNIEQYNNSFGRPAPAPMGLSLNLGGLSNLANRQKDDVKDDDDSDDVVATARVDCTPRLAVTKLQLISPRFTEGINTGHTTTAILAASHTTANSGNQTHRRSHRAGGETPRITTARMFRSTYIDPTTSASRRHMSIIGDSTSHHGSPKNHSPSPTSPAMSSPNFKHPDITAATPRRVITDDELQKTEAAADGPNCYSMSMLKDTRAYNVARESTLERDGLDMTVGSLNQTHLFGLDESPDCPVCDLMEKIQKMYLGKTMRREAYYAVGWIPDMCLSWAADHRRVWTLEERTMIATALSERPKLSTLRNRTCEGYVYLWRKRRFWKKPWRPVYAVIQGVFLYIFNTNVGHEPLIAIIPIRASYIEAVQLSGRTRCLQISSLGCKHCVGGKDGDCVETMTISVDTDEQLGHWVVALQTKQGSCAHKCSTRFLTQVEGIRDVAEMLIELAATNERKEIVNRSRFRGKSLIQPGGGASNRSPEASPPPDSLRECSKNTAAGSPTTQARPIVVERAESDLNATLTPTHHIGTPPPQN